MVRREMGQDDQYDSAHDEIIGKPLRSEQRIHHLLPKVLSRIDMLVILISIVLFVPKITVLQAIRQAGTSTYIYIIIGIISFLVPCAIVSAQLNRLLPADGALYIWTYRALGRRWGFFAAFCAWFPGILVMLISGNLAITALRNISIQIFGSAYVPPFTPWQQGLMLIVILLLAGWLSQYPLAHIMKLARVSVMLYAITILILGVAGIIWLLHGHPVMLTQPVTASPTTANTPLAMFGVVIIALFGIEVPLNMAAETRHHQAATFALGWGTLLVAIGYLVAIFGITTVLPLTSLSSSYTLLTVISKVFGAPLAIICGGACLLFFLTSTVIYNIAYSRILFVSALDYRLPSVLTKVNRYQTPSRVTKLQTIIVLTIVVFVYFIIPVITHDDIANMLGKPGNDYLTKVYSITLVCTVILWCLSMVTLFIDLPVLLYHFRDYLRKKKDALLFPHWSLYLCCFIGTLAALAGILSAIFSPLDTHLYEPQHWTEIVVSCVCFVLVVGLIGSAYPRLMGSLNEQTDMAQENARLYEELRLAYEKLSYLDQLKDAFLMTASHELRTPLTIIQGYLELLGDANEKLDPTTRKLFINKARRGCDELVLLLTNVMDAGRLDLEVTSIHTSALPLSKVCCEVADLFETVIQQQKRQIDINISDSLFVRADETRLKQVLRNLISNALRYSLPGSPLLITSQVEISTQSVLISVIDYGWGVPQDKQQSIFERFIRLDRDLNGNVRGSGLGLAICRQLVEAMQGTISVKSTGIQGEGSTFTFTLPLIEQ